jgi:hypothetical protein
MASDPFDSTGPVKVALVYPDMRYCAVFARFVIGIEFTGYVGL